MPVLPFPEPRYLLERKEIDGTWRPIARLGRPLIYATPHLAAAMARLYRPNVRVRDTQEVE